MPTFADIASGDARFNILLNAATFVDAQLPGTNLIATLSDPTQTLTVFAPTDAAFAKLAADQGFAGDITNEADVTAFLITLGPELLRDVILYHVVGTPLSAADVAAATTIQPLSGPVITPDLPTLVDAEPDLIDPTLIQTDIAADNGILHIIDRVLIPADLAGNDASSITGIVAASGPGFDDNAADFDILLQAVTTANLAGTLDDANADLTVFAPTDAAFVNLAQALGFEGSDESGAWGYLVEALTLLGGGDPVPLLTEILTYHVAGESLQASQVLASAGITTLQGGTLTLDGTSIVDADPDLPNPNLIQTDIQASNGVVHAIDNVLAPADLLQSDGANDVDFVIAGDGFDFINTGADQDYVDGNGGVDLIYAGAGNDTVFGGDGLDALIGQSGDDLLSGDGGNDYVNGGDGEDALLGGAHDDLLVGGSGHDWLWGGSGNDIMLGGSGNDAFVFTRMSGHDTVADFRDGTDYIDVADFGFGSFDELSGRITDYGIASEISLDDDTSVFLIGVGGGRLGAEDFIL